MRRTRFNNVIDLSAAKKRQRLRKRRMERQQAQAARNWRIGIMICLDKITLPPRDQALCEAIRAIPHGDGVPKASMMALANLITSLVGTGGVTADECTLDEIDDGGPRMTG